MSDLGLYVHIPFCASKCRYCDFLSFAGRRNLTGRYMDELVSEIADRSADFADRRVTSIYIGGGTPSFLPSDDINRITDAIGTYYDLSPDAEISIEVNPGSADSEKLRGYKRSGINRLSIGLQSADDRELAVLGRIHTWDEFLRTYGDARDAGFDNINIDLISAIPGQDTESWRRTLSLVLKEHPEHISAYSLQLEEDTYFYEHRDEYEWPDEECDREMYHLTKEMLSKDGYARYEISNYALPGRECRHNIIYWQGGEYLGLGLGAASYTDGARYRNTAELELYLRGIRQTENTVLSECDMMEEYMFLGLRMTSGISIRGFADRFGRDMYEVYQRQLDRCRDEGLIEINGDSIRLTDLGLDVSNLVFARFLLNDH